MELIKDIYKMNMSDKDSDIYKEYWSHQNGRRGGPHNHNQIFQDLHKLIPEDKFGEELNLYCEDLASRAPIALSQVKKIIHQGMEMTLEESLLLEQQAFGVTMNSKDAARAMRSLLNAEENIENVSKFEWKGE